MIEKGFKSLTTPWTDESTADIYYIQAKEIAIMDVNRKGVKGLIKVIDDLQDQGYYTFPAFDDHSPIDLVAISPLGEIFRLQIKYREMNPKKKNRYEFATSSVVNGKRVEMDRKMIDGWAVYLKEHNTVVYVSKDEMGSQKYFSIDPNNKKYGQMAEWSNAPIY